jgi:hypothetical protein
MSPTVNRDYFPNQYQKVDQYYGEMLCFLWGTVLILEYYLNKIQFQRVISFVC